MSVSEDIRELARERMSATEIVDQLKNRYQYAYNVQKAEGPVTVRPQAAGMPTSLNFTDALVLVSCVSRKFRKPAPARLLYRSAWFAKVRMLVEAHQADWFILSALHGVVAPDAQIAPYERTLKTLGVADRRKWARVVEDQLVPLLKGRKRVVIFAGKSYREFLVPALEEDGHEVIVPMARLRIGEQLRWLATRIT